MVMLVGFDVRCARNETSPGYGADDLCKPSIKDKYVELAGIDDEHARSVNETVSRRTR